MPYIRGRYGAIHENSLRRLWEADKVALDCVSSSRKNSKAFYCRGMSEFFNSIDPLQAFEISMCLCPV